MLGQHTQRTSRKLIVNNSLEQTTFTVYSKNS